MIVVCDLLALSSEAPAAAPGSAPGVAVRRELILLRAVFGQDEANHGTVRYPVDADGLIRVPLEAVSPLIGNGGFALPKTTGDLVSAGMLKLHHDGAAGCCCAGANIPVMRTATCSYLPRPLPSSWRMVLCPCFKAQHRRQSAPSGY